MITIFRSVGWILRWFALLTPVALIIGSGVAFFLWSLDRVTDLRVENGWLIYLLPFAGIPLVFIYTRYGEASNRGNNQIIDSLHLPDTRVPKRMAFFVLIGTLWTHLFGGSAGREGTAVQMGGSLAAPFHKLYRFNEADRRLLIKAGVAAGFGAVFGTPLAGALFALEFHTRRRIATEALIPCLIAAYLGDFVCTAWGVKHTAYELEAAIPDLVSLVYRIDLILAAKVAFAGMLFGLAAFVYIRLVDGIHHQLKHRVERPLLHPVLGGVVLLLLTTTLGTTAYLGLGVYPQDDTGISIVAAFDAGGVTAWSWFWKLLFTAITLASGFKGGEVTPLFFMGACLGNAIAMILGVAVDIFAALGFIALFAAATKTPMTSIVMGVELFGADHLPYYAIAVVVAVLISGDRSVYSAQRSPV